MWAPLEEKLKVDNLSTDCPIRTQITQKNRWKNRTFSVWAFACVWLFIEMKLFYSPCLIFRGNTFKTALIKVTASEFYFFVKIFNESVLSADLCIL